MLYTERIDPRRVRHYNTEKEKDMGLIKAAMGACGTVNKGKFCANCGTPRP